MTTCVATASRGKPDSTQKLFRLSTTVLVHSVYAYVEPLATDASPSIGISFGGSRFTKALEYLPYSGSHATVVDPKITVGDRCSRDSELATDCAQLSFEYVWIGSHTTGESIMTTQQLFYETVVPVSSKRHGQWSVDRSDGYAFSRKVNSVPLMGIEFHVAAAEYPIVFSGNDETVMPVVLLGIHSQENLYIDPQGGWQARYIPAFIRRYPFVLSTGEDNQQFTLCIDEAHAGCNEEGRGDRLFADDGQRTPYVDNLLNFLKDYQHQIQQTQVFCRQLKALGLLEPMQAQLSFPEGGRLSLRGFQVVSRDKLKALAPEVLAELARSNAMELIYLHLESMRNFENLVKRAQVAGGGIGVADRLVAKKSNGAAHPAVA